MTWLSRANICKRKLTFSGKPTNDRNLDLLDVTVLQLSRIHHEERIRRSDCTVEQPLPFEYSTDTTLKSKKKVSTV